jgi:hypothetical protein
MHLRVLALGYARTEVNKSSYLFSYILTMTSQRPKRQIKKPSQYSQSPLSIPLDSQLSDIPEVHRPKKDLCRQSLLSLSLKTSPRPSNLRNNVQSHPTLHHPPVQMLELLVLYLEIYPGNGCLFPGLLTTTTTI